MRYTQFFQKLFLEISVPFDFHPESPEFSVEWFAFRKFNNFRIFWNFRTFCPGFENFEIFGRMVSAHVYTDTDKFRPSLPSHYFNPRQPARIALNFPPNLFVRWESPLLEDLFLE